MTHRDGGHDVTVAPHALRGLKLDDIEPVWQATVNDSHHPHQLLQARRPVHAQRLAALAQREGLQHAGQPKPVVGMEVGDEHAVQVQEPDRAQELALSAFAAVEQQPVAAAPDQHRGQPATRARHRAGGTSEEQ